MSSFLRLHACITPLNQSEIGVDFLTICYCPYRQTTSLCWDIVTFGCLSATWI